MAAGREDEESFLSLHLKGTSIRTLAHRAHACIRTAFRRIVDELKVLPSNNQVTHDYCNRKRFCGALVVDGKYVKVKGYKKKIPFLYGMDYMTHDLPCCILTSSESYEAWVQFFTKLKNMDYPLVSLTCDDNPAIKQAAQYVFHNVVVQICHVHFLENIRKQFKVRTRENYVSFFKDIETHIFHVPMLGKDRLEARIRWRSPKHQNDSIKIAVMNHIFTHAEELTAYVNARN